MLDSACAQVSKHPMWCKKRRASPASRGMEPPQHVPQTEVATGVSASNASVVCINCRGTHFETTRATLLRLGPCYLATQTQIDTSEAIFLDYSPAAFCAVLDALTLAQHDINKSLIHLAHCRGTVVDLPALLDFLALEWTLGVHLRLPPAPAIGTPSSDKWAHDRCWGGLGSAYHVQTGVFHHLARNAPVSNKRAKRDDLNFKELPLPYGYSKYGKDLPLKDDETYDEQILCEAGCVPVSVENDAEHEGVRGRDWWGKRVASIFMVPLQGRDDRGEFVPLHGRTSVVVDLGPRRILLCEGIVLRIFKEQNVQMSTHDMLVVEAVSDFDQEQTPRTLLCQEVHLKHNYSTYCRVVAPLEMQGFGRIFRLTLYPFQSEHQFEFTPGNSQMYKLEQVEFFGTLLHMPMDLVLEEHLLHNFVMDKNAQDVVQVRRRY